MLGLGRQCGQVGLTPTHDEEFAQPCLQILFKLGLGYARLLEIELVENCP